MQHNREENIIAKIYYDLCIRMNTGQVGQLVSIHPKLIG